MRGTCARAIDPELCTWAGLAHVRRAFKEAADALGKVSSRAGTAQQGLAYIAKLYRIESELSKYRKSDPEPPPG